MKKLLGILFVVGALLSVGTSAFADETAAGTGTIHTDSFGPGW